MEPLPTYTTTRLPDIKRIISAGHQPMRVDVIDDKYLAFTFPANTQQQPAEGGR